MADKKQNGVGRIHSAGWGIGVLILGAMIAWVSLDRRGGFEPGSVPATAPSDTPIRNSRSAHISAPLVPSQKPSIVRSEAPGSEALWERFKARFGQDLTAQFDPTGRLLSIRRSGNRVEKASSDFRSDDPQKTIARAKEVLEAASPLIGVNPAWPLGKPLARPGASSAQVYFQESAGGIPLAPYGSVKVDLDSNGGLLGLESGYIPDLSLANEPKIDSESARTQARAAVAASDSSNFRAEGGDLVIWVPHPAQKPPVARYAYEYTVGGRQIIVDASDGKILLKHDQREY